MKGVGEIKGRIFNLIGRKKVTLGLNNSILDYIIFRTRLLCNLP